MDINYKKVNNNKLFDNLAIKSLLNVDNIQNYIPIYNLFFDLNENNSNAINLNNQFYLKYLTEKLNENVYKCKLDEECENNNLNIKENLIFLN